MSPVTARTVVEAFLPLRGDVSLAAVYDAANAAGIDDQTLRLAIRRMQSAGDLRQEGRGRAGRLVMTAAGRKRIMHDRLALELAAAQDAGKVSWDGAWRLFTLSVPERDRAMRDALRRMLIASGAASLSAGVFVSPHDLSALLPAQAEQFMVTARMTDLNVRGVRDPIAITETLWPAAPVDAGYDAVDQALTADNPNVCADVRLLFLAAALEDAIRDDPLIPPELRPLPWRPAQLRQQWMQRWKEIGPAIAYAEWPIADS
ncbi:PaaX family transcriptional regulator [Arthrobacter sp. JCM 19049]|uniref:PaaX family transcriptional regulator n=1 Tax=Arthrobacter sp. JCM 19049 TaxID=1460643 RepID=UPI0006D0FFD8|nr:PaaX family transcriptional regulator [Arthrobacter sp. JCM 19049]